MGKFTHFRHSVFARNDDKIKEFSRLLDRKGKEGYFYYFALIEHCSSESEEGQTEFKIHNETLRSLWESNAKGVQTLCKLLANSALVVCKPCVNHVVFDIPNLPNYLGSYETKKEKKIKERKENKPSLVSDEIKYPEKNLPGEKIQGNLKTDHVEELFNKVLAGKGQIKHHRSSSVETLKNLLNCFSFKEFSTIEAWEEIFSIVAASPFLTGQSGTNFVATLDWLSQHKNASKVLNGGFSGLNKLTHGKQSSRDPRNKTNNPYIQEAIDEGYIA